VLRERYIAPNDSWAPAYIVNVLSLYCHCFPHGATTIYREKVSGVMADRP